MIPSWLRLPALSISKDWRIALALFFIVLLTYLSNTNLKWANDDSLPNAFLPVTILEDGDFAFSPFEAPSMFYWRMQGLNNKGALVSVKNMDEKPPGSQKSFYELFKNGRLKFIGPKYYLVPTIRKRVTSGEPLFVGTFGFAAGLTSLPLAAFVHWSGVRLMDNTIAIWKLAKLTAALLAAGSAMIIYLTAILFVPRRQAVLLSGAYALGTCIWSLSSQSLWQQTPEIFFLSLGVYWLLRIPGSWLRGAAIGLALSAAAACRPTAALVAMLVAGWLLFSDRRAFAAFVLAALPLALTTFIFNYYYFGSPLDFGQLAAGKHLAEVKTGSADLWQTPLWLGAAGLLVSPSRGMLIYSPILAAAFAGAVLVWRDPRYRELRVLVLAVLALWITAFCWFDWWGGWTYGYRPIVDSVPLLAILCLPVMESILKQPVWRVVFALLLCWSVLVQWLGVYAYTPMGWNNMVVDAKGDHANIDHPAYRHRLWSFRDWQIGYLIANFRLER